MPLQQWYFIFQFYKTKIQIDNPYFFFPQTTFLFCIYIHVKLTVQPATYAYSYIHPQKSASCI